MDLYTGAMPGDHAVPDVRMERWKEVCQSGISDGQKDGRNRGGVVV